MQKLNARHTKAHRYSQTAKCSLRERPLMRLSDDEAAAKISQELLV